MPKRKPPEIGSASFNMLIRLNAVLAGPNIKDAKAWSRAAGLSDSYVNTLRSRLASGDVETAKHECIAALARAASVKTEWLFGTDDDPIPAATSRSRAPRTPNLGLDEKQFEAAVHIVRETQRCSVAWLARKLPAPYVTAERIVELLQRHGIVGPAFHEVLPEGDA